MRIAINGFGRIGRVFFRQAFGHKNVEVVAINDLGSVENLAYLLKYDSVYGKYDKEVGHKIDDEHHIVVDGKEIRFFQEKDPANLPWKKLDIDVVVESTGVFDSFEKASPHLDAGAKRVVITAPAKDDNASVTFTPNVGTELIKKSRITSNASCTTNAATPVTAIMMQNPGIKKALLNTVHGYTASQNLVDGPAKKDFRRGRAAAVNIVPSSTGAAEAVIKAAPFMKGKFDGIAMRVPVLSGSLIDFTFVAGRETSAEEINDIFRKAAASPEWKGIMRVCEEPLVSADILGEPYGSIVDLDFTRVVDGDLVKVLSWYDNEWGYGSMLLKHVEALEDYL
ncbi:MAG: type I glyceraldehyde-3-phosphate dehydrogenase [Candidatus Niyogibacteria bacterium]|nr:MAG: type I glyceraldehyde-3-phosphate dehydrogenase [Candidatus Niyogibacteria bacterium]